MYKGSLRVLAQEMFIAGTHQKGISSNSTKCKKNNKK